MSALDFPLNPVENQLYQTADGQSWIYLDGAWRLKASINGTGPINVVLNRYDLAIEATTGASDLSKSQVFSINNTTTSAKTISFSGAPVGRAMTVVLEVTGAAGSIGLPSDLVYAADVDSSLSTVRTVFVLLWNGTTFLVTANIKF